MKRFYFVCIKLFFIPLLFSQQGFVNSHAKGLMNPKNREANKIQNQLILPYLSRATPKNTFYVKPGNSLYVTDSVILIVNKATGRAEKKLNLNRSYQKSCNVLDKTEINLSPVKNKQDGWITWAECWYFDSDPKPTYFSAEWVVPNPPLRKSDQLIYLFAGLVGEELTDSTLLSYILQPVLQWGISPAGGGKYWSVCNWFVMSEDQYFHDSLIKVNPGDRLQGVVKCMGSTDSTYSYNSSFTGYGEGLNVHDIKGLGTGYLALETYGVRNCIDNPADEKLRMFNIQMMIDEGYPKLNWHIYNDIDHCGEFTNLIHESSYNGEINIHFHKPYSEDNFEDIYIYPNPVQDILHISITSPIYSCRIEIYNGLGILMLTETHEVLEYEYDLSLQHYPPGIYFAKFYYQKDKYTRETNHTFKFIKAGR